MGFRDIVELSKNLVTPRPSAFLKDENIKPKEQLIAALEALQIDIGNDGYFFHPCGYLLNCGIVISLEQYKKEPMYQLIIYPSQFAYTKNKAHVTSFRIDGLDNFRDSSRFTYLNQNGAILFSKDLVILYDRYLESGDKEMYAGIINIFEKDNQI